FDPADFEPSPYAAVPAFPDLPMEEVYPRDKAADYEEVLYRRFGKGRAVYFCGDPDRCYWDYLLPDERRLLVNSLRWAIAEDDAVRVKGPGLIDVTLWENEQGLMLHLVNLTSVHAMRGPAEEILPLSGIEIEIRNDLVNGAEVKSLENEAVFSEKGEKYTKVTLPVLKLHEVLVFGKKER
ncbi:MAG: hypothetical protein IKR59_07575, partial [Lachnospiraceae bacterium]|nr:hypothetical protein [Lachnospiraceae bacterium]